MRARRDASQVHVLTGTFAERASRVPEVSRVLLVEDGRGVAAIWTVLDAKPKDRDLRHRIYDIEGEVLDEFPSVSVEFRVVNLSEMQDSDSVHVPEGTTVYQRR